eukprot:6173348-Pleurochrysis_carterae.AAC.1
MRAHVALCGAGLRGLVRSMLHCAPHKRSCTRSGRTRGRIASVLGPQVLARSDLCLNPEQRVSGKALNFYDLSERARLFHHGVLLGWKRADEETSRLQNKAAALRSLKADLISVVDESTARGLRGVEFNPKDKAKKLRWHDTDRLLLLVRLPEPRYSLDSLEHGSDRND